jgi:3-dehydroquinate dehydratase-2
MAFFEKGHFFCCVTRYFRSMQIAIINGPNLNLLGKREPGVYGSESFESFFEALCQQYPNVQFRYFQSNVEGELINYLHEVGFSCDGIIINPGGYTHTSVALGDAIAAIKSPVIEVHISNTAAREEFRHISHVSAKCKGTIIGLGLKGYELALQYFLS